MASLFGLGVGMILKHGAAATSSVLIWALVLENLIRGFAPPTWSRPTRPSAPRAVCSGIRQPGDTDETVAAALSRSRTPSSSAVTSSLPSPSEPCSCTDETPLACSSPSRRLRTQKGAGPVGVETGRHVDEDERSSVQAPRPGATPRAPTARSRLHVAARVSGVEQRTTSGRCCRSWLAPRSSAGLKGRRQRPRRPEVKRRVGVRGQAISRSVSALACKVSWVPAVPARSKRRTVGVEPCSGSPIGVVAKPGSPRTSWPRSGRSVVAGRVPSLSASCGRAVKELAFEAGRPPVVDRRSHRSATLTSSIPRRSTTSRTARSVSAARSAMRHGSAHTALSSLASLIARSSSDATAG